jgi:parallel beta-helix repeat protein
MRFIVATVLALAVCAQADIIHVVANLGNSKQANTAQNVFSDLQTAINKSTDGDTILVSPDTFSAQGTLYIENLCGNCQNHQTKVQASRGFLIENKQLIIIGSGQDSTILNTNAGYGVLFVNSPGSQISNLKITGGRRDRDGTATDAAIVARSSRILISNCLISDNTNKPESLVVGIGGIFGREGAELEIRDNIIKNNGWDGIALYRGATAVIHDNIIDGGRGAGIGVTWDAAALIYRNTVKNYWKGIGAFGSSRVVASNNLVADNLGWGIIVTGSGYMDVTNNVVVHNGNCGLAIWSDSASGRFANNIVVNNGWRDEWVCPQVGFWNYGYPDRFVISHNNIFNNAAGQYRDMPDQTDKQGNISNAPKFVGDNDYHLAADSPCHDSGDEAITDNDGTRSDMGLFGGPRSWQK